MRPLRTCLLILAAIPAFAIADDYSLTVSGDVPKERHFSLADLAKLKHATVTLKEHDGTVNGFDGVALADVLVRAGLELGDHVRGKSLAGYVLVTASDGYQVLFGLGEIEPTISGRTIELCDRINGKAVPEGIGPVRLVVQDDKKPARCVRMVTSIKVVRLAGG